MAILGICLVLELVLLPIGVDDLDEGYFAQQAQRILEGQLPYRDFESLYTPGLTYLHAAIFALFGGPYLLLPRTLSMIFRSALVALLYGLSRPLVPHPLWAAVPGAFVLLGFDAAPDRWEPHPGWPSTTFAVLAVWLAARSPSSRSLLLSGAVAGASYLFKQNAGALLLLALLLQTRRRAWLPLLGYLAVTAVWLLPLLVAIDGRLDLLKPLVGAVNQSGLVSPPELTIAIPLACLAAGFALLREPPMRWLLLAGVCLFATQYPRSDTVHLAWSAPLLLVVGAVALSRTRVVLALPVLGAAMLLCLPVLGDRIGAIREASTAISGIPAANGVRVPAQTWSDLLTTTAEVTHRTSPGEPIFVYPSSPLLYVLAERPNATRFDHLNPGAATATQVQEVIESLHAVRVAVVSDYWRAAWGPPRENAPLEQSLFDQFHEVAHFGQYRVFERNL